MFVIKKIPKFAPQWFPKTHSRLGIKRESGENPEQFPLL